MRDEHKAALKEVLPLLIYPGMYSVDFGVAAFTPLYVSYVYLSTSISFQSRHSSHPNSAAHFIPSASQHSTQAMCPSAHTTQDGPCRGGHVARRR